MIVIVDSGGANIASIVFAFKRLGCEASLSADPAVIQKAQYVIFPGVGAAGDAMERLRQRDLVTCLQMLKQPVLGICLGMQLLFQHSDENDCACLSMIDGRVRHFNRCADMETRAVPHMGWNAVTQKNGGSRLMRDIDEGSYFYFVHSYVAPLGPWVKGACRYGCEVPAIVEKDNFYGTQFHPERSGKWGSVLLRNFIEL